METGRKRYHIRNDRAARTQLEEGRGEEERVRGEKDRKRKNVEPNLAKNVIYVIKKFHFCAFLHSNVDDSRNSNWFYVHGL